MGDKKFTIHLSFPEVQKLTPPKDTVLISIRDIGEVVDPAITWTYEDVLKLNFEDVVVSHDKNSPGVLDARKIADFIQKWWGKNIIVHCEMGVSRSAAVVEVLERLGWKNIHPAHNPPEHRSTAMANPLLVRLLASQFSQLRQYEPQADRGYRFTCPVGVCKVRNAPIVTPCVCLECTCPPATCAQMSTNICKMSRQASKCDDVNQCGGDYGG